MTHPFDVKKQSSCLIKISYGFHASPEVDKSLFGAVYSVNTSTCDDATLSTGKKKSLYSAISRSGVTGFHGFEEEGITKR